MELPHKVGIQKQEVTMRMIDTGRRVISGWMAFLLTGFSATMAEPAAKKNVLFFFIDDLRPELGCYGADLVKSPEIDKLATQGVLFERAYCQQALCGPSRISMLSGQYPYTTGITDLWTPLTKAIPDALSLPRYFKKRGYFTGSYGKVYHHTRDDKSGWTELMSKPGEKYANPETLEGIKRRTQEGEKKGLSVDKVRILGKGPATEIADVEDDAYPDGKIANQAIQSLRKNKGKPFFICVGITKPHLPFAAPRKYWDLYERDDFEVPERKLPENAPSLAFTVWGELRSYRGMPKEGHLSDAQTKELRHGYAASVSFADAQVGKVLAELDRLGLREETIVVLWGDHGYKLGDYGAWCKHTNLELDARVPFIVSAPGFPKGQRSKSLVEMVDVFPTLAKLTGGEVPASCDGRSLEPVLKKPDQPFRPYAFTMYPRGKTAGYSIRTDRWRYTEWFNTEKKQIVARELYDHQDTQTPASSLAGEAKHAELVSSLSETLGAEKLTAKTAKRARK